MTEFLPTPEIVRCFFETDLTPHLSAMELCWRGDTPGTAERLWHLPQGVTVRCSAPVRFGISVQRHGDDAYKVRVLWNQLHFGWNPLTRVQVMTSSLPLILQALGTDMWNLLHQSVSAQPPLAA